MHQEPDPAARLLWGPPPKAGRGPKAALSLDRIARAGIEIADAEGLGALSMQRVAGLLDYTKMALYRYVPGKAELVALMVDAAIGAAPPVDGTGWRDPLADWSRRLAAVFRRHPGCWTPPSAPGWSARPNSAGWNGPWPPWPTPP